MAKNSNKLGKVLKEEKITIHDNNDNFNVNSTETENLASKLTVDNVKLKESF